MTDIETLLRADAERYTYPQPPPLQPAMIAVTAPHRHPSRWLATAATILIVAAVAAGPVLLHRAAKHANPAANTQQVPKSITVNGQPAPLLGELSWTYAITDPADPRTIYVYAASAGLGNCGPHSLRAFVTGTDDDAVSDLAGAGRTADDPRHPNRDRSRRYSNVATCRGEAVPPLGAEWLRGPCSAMDAASGRRARRERRLHRRDVYRSARWDPDAAELPVLPARIAGAGPAVSHHQRNHRYGLPEFAAGSLRHRGMVSRRSVNAAPDVFRCSPPDSRPTGDSREVGAIVLVSRSIRPAQR
jgi:hypothetical protein